tara:strand:+ start:7011 stop:7151 length:141 start_codon:yes stop_codon:yes gene_type:complete
MTIEITVESKEHKDKILQVLEDAEMDGVLNFSFSVQIIEKAFRYLL